jgi:hypothetical protein
MLSGDVMLVRSLRFAVLPALAAAAVAYASAAIAQDLPRMADGRPDLQGIWQVRNRASYDLEDHVARHEMPAGWGVVAGGAIPYQPWAAAQKRANFENRAAADPLEKCYLPGVPRVMYLEWPFQIFQTSDHVAMTFEWQQVHRLIYTTGEPQLHTGVESWMGHSRGRWEGDTLVVEVTDHNDRTWLDAAGNFHSNALRVTERYKLVDADTLQYEATIEDPNVFTRPWTISMPLHRQKNTPRILEYPCQAELEEANGAFERDERTWYPAPARADNARFDPNARAALRQLATPRDIPRLADGKPDLNGWYESDGGGANYGLETRPGVFLTPGSRGIVVDPTDGTLPYQPWARAERVDRELPHRGYDDPTAHCFLAGIPRSYYIPAPLHIVHTAEHFVTLFERMSWRLVPLGRQTHIPDHLRLWQGDSIGRWDGDTLVVQTKNLNGKAWLNEVGDVLSHAAEVVETFTPVSATQVIYRATVSDPLAYTRPWTIEVPLNRQPDELLEVACLEDNNDLEHLRAVRDEYRQLNRETQ